MTRLRPPSAGDGQDESFRKITHRLMRFVGLHSRDFSSTVEFLAHVNPQERDCILVDMTVLATDIGPEVEVKRRGIDMPVIAVSTQADAKNRPLANTTRSTVLLPQAGR